MYVVGQTGHLEVYCRHRQPTTHNAVLNEDNAKTEKQIAVLNQAKNPDTKYVVEIEINDKQMLCQVDLGSQFTNYLNPPGKAQNTDVESLI